MKKLLLCGATHGSNFGDSLFAYLFIKEIKESGKNIEIVFTRASEYSKKELGIKTASLWDLFTADAMIYISGGYFGESHNESFKGSVYRFIIYYIYGLLMILRKRPIAIIGVGAGPLNRWFLRKTVTLIFNKAKVISLRDEDSKNYMINYGVKNEITITTDSAQVISDYIYSFQNEINNKILNNSKLLNRKKILIHIAGVQEDKIYYDKVIMAIKETLSKDNNNSFIITSDSIIDENYLLKVYNALPNDRSIIYNYNNPIDFLEIIASVDSIITPKLHVGIIGCTFGKPVLSFPIHPGKTERYFKQIGYSKHCKSLYNINKDEVKEMINKYIWSDIKLKHDIKVSALKNFEILNEFLEKYMQ